MTMLAEPFVDTVRAQSVSGFQGDWIVACCEPRLESRLVRELTDEAGIPSFWPRVQVKRREVDRRGNEHRRIVLRSLFPGYVSFCCEERQLYRVIEHSDVQNILSPPVQRNFVKEISLIETSIAQNPRMVSYPVDTIGDRCRIKSGTFRNFEGKLIRIDGETKFLVEIETFGGRLVPLQIDPSLLEPV